MFDAAKALFLSRGNEDPVAHHTRRSIAVIGIKAENDHNLLSLNISYRAPILKLTIGATMAPVYLIDIGDRR
jgi:hypothetical protein